MVNYDTTSRAGPCAWTRDRNGDRSISMPLDRAQVIHIAALARIGISDDEIDAYAGQLSDIIEQFEALNELDTTGIEPTGHAGELRAVMRDDVPEDSLLPEEALSNAPRREGEFFRVKSVLDE